MSGDATPLGVFARVFPVAPPAELAATIAGHGFDCVQLNLVAVGLPTVPEPHELPALPLEEVGAAFAAAGVSVWGLSATYNMAHPDPERRARETTAAAALIRAAPRVGARAVSLCTGTRDPDNQWRAHPDNTTAAAWDDMITSFGPLLAAAAEAGVQLAVEPEPANVVAGTAEAVRLLAELGERGQPVGIILDAANLVAEVPPDQRESRLREAYEQLGERTICLHAKDVVPWGRRLAGDRSGLDFGLLAELRSRLPRTVPLIIQDTAPDEVAAAVSMLRDAARAVNG